jgi:BolA protein
MEIHRRIEHKLTEALEPVHLEVLNESHMHNVPAGSESHFKVTVVSEKFEGQGLVNRHRLVNQALAEELRSSVHALALHTPTPGEWFESGGESPDSPKCLGGSAAQAKSQT